MTADVQLNYISNWSFGKLVVGEDVSPLDSFTRLAFGNRKVVMERLQKALGH